MSTVRKEEVLQVLQHKVASLTEKPELEYQMDHDESIQDLGMNSIRIINLVVQIEQHIEIMFDDEELLNDNFATVNIIADQIMKKLSVTS